MLGRDCTGAHAHIPLQLTLEPGTLFAAQPPELPDDDLAAEMLTAVVSAWPLRVLLNTKCLLTRSAAADAATISTIGPLATTSVRARSAWQADVRRPTIAGRCRPRARRYLAGVPAALTRKNVPVADLPFEFMLNALRLVEGFEIGPSSERPVSSAGGCADSECARAPEAADCPGHNVCFPARRAYDFLS